MTGSLLGPGSLEQPRPSGVPTDPESQGAPLAGFRIGVTSHRRSKDLIEALERRGARVLHAPALEIAGAEDLEQLAADTRAVIAARPDLLLVTTAYGLRRWCEAADASGMGDALLETLALSKIFVRGPKARGAVRAAGLDDAGISADETTATLVDLILTEAVAGKTVAVQLHAYADLTQLERLAAAGATLLTVTPYRWTKPDGDDALPALIRAVCSHELDAVTFTSAPAVDAVFSTAEEMGLRDQLTAALKSRVATAVVGPVTAKPLEAAGITPLVPGRFRMGAMIRLLCEHLAGQAAQQVMTHAGLVELRGCAVILDGSPLSLAPAPFRLMRALIEANGAVVARQDLSGLMETNDGAHALDMAISRLRAALPDSALVQTVVKRGYRLRL